MYTTVTAITWCLTWLFPSQPDQNLRETQRLLSAAAAAAAEYVPARPETVETGSADKLNYMLEESIMIEVQGNDVICMAEEATYLWRQPSYAPSPLAI